MQSKDISESTAGTGLSEDPTIATAGKTMPTRPWMRWTTPWARIVGHDYKGSGIEEDPYVVGWLPDEDGFRDRENPMTYGSTYKWTITMMAAAGTLAVSMASSMLSAAITSIRIDFPGHNDMLYIMVTGIFVLGFVVGPLLWAPCSEVFGRRAMFIFTYIPFTAFNAGACGAKDINVLLVMRFFAGTFGSSTMTNSGGIIADMFDASQRGLAMGVFAAMPFLGPAIGPVAGGFLSEKADWVWVAALIAIFSAVLTALECVFLPETYAPVLLRKRAQRLSKATGKVYRCQQDVAKPLRRKELFLNQLMVPYKLLFTEPIVFLTSIYMAVIYAILYMQFTSFPIVFQMYRHWSPGIAGLAFVGLTVGAFIALFYIIFVQNPQYARKHARLGYVPPEARLPSAIGGAILLPVGLFIFAWTCVPVTIHWSGPIIATVPFGAGLVLLFLGISNYLVDAYLLFAASVLAAGTVVRSIFGVVFPLFTVDMYDSMGPNWAGTLCACLAVVFVPCPILFLIYGKKIRRMTKPGREADDLGLMIAQMMKQKMAAMAAGGAAGGAAGAAAGGAGAAARDREAEEAEDAAIAGEATRSNSVDYTAGSLYDEEAVIGAVAELSRQRSRSSQHSRQLSRTSSQYSRSIAAYNPLDEQVEKVVGHDDDVERIITPTPGGTPPGASTPAKTP